MQRVVVETAGWIRSAAEAESVEVQLCWDPSDPLAVRVRITREGEQLTWVFGRDLLSDGLRSMTAVGEGHVQVQATSVLTEISHLDAMGETTVLRIPWWNSREFVRMSLAQVARGQESCDVDSWVAAMTGATD